MNKYFDDYSKNRGKTLQDPPKVKHVQVQKDETAAGLYGATTPGQKYGKAPDKPTGVEMAEREFKRRKAAIEWNERVAAGSPEQSRLNSLYGSTTPQRKAKPGIGETWTTTPSAQKR